MLTKEGSIKIVNFITLGTGVLVLGHGHINHIVKMRSSFKNLLLYSQAQIRQTKYILMITKKGSTQIGNFMTPGTGVLGFGHISHKVKMHYFFKNLFLYSHAQIRQTIYKVMVTNEGSNKNVTFMTQGQGFLCQAVTYMATLQHQNPCPRGHDIYNFGIPYLGHYYYILGLSDLCLGVKKIFKRNNAFSIYDLNGHTLAQDPLLRGS